jgi:hypothetical protein
MDRQAKDFLAGFRRAAQLTNGLRADPPRHTEASDYLEGVAALHRRSADLVRQGLAAGCLCALGRA